MSSEQKAYADEMPLEGGAPETDHDRPVDLVHLAKYTMGNRELEHEVLHLFCKQSLIYLDRLRNAADDRTWVEAAHTLKGSAAGIGAWHVADVARALERLSFAAAEGDKDEAIEALATSVDEANTFINGLLADQ